MRLRELIGDRSLDLSVMVGSAEALEAEVRTAYVTDLPDPTRFVGPGTVVLSSGLWSRVPGGVDRFLDALAGRRAAALLLGLVELGRVPAAVLNGCRERDLPLVTTGDDVSFASIVEAVHESHDGRSRFADRIAQALTEGPPQEALALAEAELGVRCWVSDDSGAIIPEPQEQLWPHVLAGAAQWSEPTERSDPGADDPAITTWRLDDSADGLTPLLLADLSQAGPAARRALTTVAFILRPELRLAARLRAHRRAHTRHLVEAAVTGTLPAAELSALARLLGLQPGRALRVVAVDAPDLPPAARAGLAVRLTGSTAAADFREQAVVLVHEDADDVPELIHRRALERIAAEAPVRVGLAVSDSVTELDLLGPAVSTTLTRLPRSPRAGGPPRGTTGRQRLFFARAGDVGDHRDLLAQLSPAAREAFARGTLDGLLRYDRKHGTDLLQTLRVFLDSGGAWQEAARLLQVHPNTLRYRVGRIETLTERDLSRMPDRVDLYLALTCQQD